MTNTDEMRLGGDPALEDGLREFTAAYCSPGSAADHDSFIYGWRAAATHYQDALKAEQKTTDLYHDNWKAAERKYKAALVEARTAINAADAAGDFRGHIGEMAQATMDNALTTINTILGEV